MEYSAEYPDVPVDDALKYYFENFYRISDTPEAHEEYSQQFTDNAILVMASKKATGRADILALRKGMWEKVSGRRHYPLKVFPFGKGANEVMLYGTVDYTLKAGGSVTVPWAAHAVLKSVDGNLKMSFYQVYLDTAAQNQR